MKLQRQRPDDFKAKLEPTCRNEPEHKCKTALNSYPTPNIPSNTAVRTTMLNIAFHEEFIHDLQMELMYKQKLWNWDC